MFTEKNTFSILYGDPEKSDRATERASTKRFLEILPNMVGTRATLCRCPREIV
jgi:hypothetical protein